MLFASRWKVAALAAVVVLAAGGVAWRVFFHRPPTDEGLAALRAAYSERRPLEARITELNYAPYVVTRGAENEGADARARDLAAARILGADTDDRSPAALHNVGRYYLTQRDFDKALAAFEEALPAAPGDARLHCDAGVALFEKGKQERAGDQSGRGEVTLAKSLEHLKRALELDDTLLEARFNRALLYMALGLEEQAAEDWEKYLARDSSSPWAEEARKYLGRVRGQGRKVAQRDEDLFRDFMRAYEAGEQEQVWRIFSKSNFRTGNLIVGRLIDEYLDSASGGRAGQAEHLSRALTRLGQLSAERADDRFTAALADFYRSSSGNHKALAKARALMRDAYGLYNQSKNGRAVELYSEAKAIFERLGDLPEALLAEYWIGHCYFQQPDTRRSLDSFTRLAARCERMGYRWLQAIALNGSANVRSRTTDYSRAVDDCRDSYRISALIADDNGALRSLSTLAALYRQLGKYRESLGVARRGLDLSQSVAADASQVVGFYATSAQSLSSLGHNAAALEYAKKTLSLGEAMGGGPLVMSRYHVQLGLIHGKLKNYDEALRNIRRGLEIGQAVQAERIGAEMTTYALLYLGRIYRQSGLYADALGALDEAARFRRRENELWLLHEAYKERLLTYISVGDVALARVELQRVLGAYDEQRQKILEEGNRNTFFDKEQDIYDVAIGFAHGPLGDARQSFEYSEGSRARSLLDAATTRWQVRDESGVPQLRFPGASRSLALDEIRARLPAGAQLVQYAALRDRLVIWYVSADRFESRTVEIGLAELTAKVERLVGLVSRRPGGDDDGRRLLKVSSELYDILVQPVAALLDERKQLCIVPDKSLNFLPFGALVSPSSRRYLAASFPLLYAPSANMFVHDTALANSKEAVAGERLLSVGNPHFDRDAFPQLSDLPAAAREAAEIAPFYGSHALLTGADAGKARVAAEMPRADVLHFATHYVPDESTPMFSKLLLARGAAADAASAPGGFLLAHEIYRLSPARARLAVLSACRTGVEEYFNGEGAVGLARPFKAAGVPLVVASLWPVDSEATADLMIDFHRLRKPGVIASAEALRRAQAQMLDGPNPDYRHPHYWASFVVIGGYSVF